MPRPKPDDFAKKRDEARKKYGDLHPKYRDQGYGLEWDPKIEDFQIRKRKGGKKGLSPAQLDSAMVISRAIRRKGA